MERIATEKKSQMIRREVSGEEIVRMESVDSEKGLAEFVIATGAPVIDDWSGIPNSLLLDGVELKEYRDNPIVLWGHSFDKPEEIIGRSIKVFKEADKLIARVQFDIDDEFAARVFGKIARGYLRAASVGYLPIRKRYVEEGETDKSSGLVGPVNINTKWRLCEWSVVGIGADPGALGREALMELDEPVVDPVNRFFIPMLKRNERKKNEL